MLRVMNLSRAQPVARNLTLVTQRLQQASTTPSSSGPSDRPNNPQKTTTTPSSSGPSDRPNNPQKTTTTPPSSSGPNHPQKTTTTPPPTTPPPSTPRPSSRPADASSGSGGGGTVKAIVYGVALGLGVTLLYAEYDNGSFRRKVESTLPLSSTILSGLDKIINPIFGRHKKLTDIISEKMPDISAVTDRLPDREQLKKAGEQVKDAANTLYNKLPDQKQIQKAGEQAKDAINDAYDKLPEYKKVKGAVTHAADQVKDAAVSVRDTVKDAIPKTKGISGEQSRRGNDPMFLEEPGEVAVPPPIKPK